MIEVVDLCKNFKYYEKEEGLKAGITNLFNRKVLTKEVIKSINFSICEGEKVGFIGPNGAGKTTTLKMLSGILYPTSGMAKVMGYIPWERSKEFKMKFSFMMGQRSQLWVDLPAVDSLGLYKYIYEISNEQYNTVVSELMDLLNIGHLKNIQVRRLSLGERMKFEFVASMLHHPQILFLDEPTIGLDIIAQHSIREFLKEYNHRYNTTIILKSHYLKDIEDICDRVILINNGSLVFDNSLEKLKEGISGRKVIVFDYSGQNKEEMSRVLDAAVEIDNSKVKILVDKKHINKLMPIIIQKYSENISIEDTSLENEIEHLYTKI